MRVPFAFVAASLALAACERQAASPVPATAPPASATASVAGAETAPTAPLAAPRPCLDEIGPEASARLVQRCRAVSPASRPPCNTANPCAMIQGEIDRSCALWARDGETPPDECRAG